MATITIPLSPSTERVLRSKATAMGLPLEEFVGQIANREAMSFDDPIFQPMQKGFEESGMSEDELVELVQVARGKNSPT